MPERLSTLLGASVALLLVVLLLVPPPDRPARESSRPLSNDVGPQGLFAALRWLEGAGVPIYSLRERYTALASAPDLPATGNLLVLPLPQRFPARAAESAALTDWLRRGNSLLVALALDDAPDWSKDLDLDDSEGLLTRLGLSLVPSALDPAEDANRPPAGDLRVASPVLPKVRTLRIERRPTDGSNRRLRTLDADRLNLILLRDMGGRPLVYQSRLGTGHLWTSRVADLFGNRHLGEADNARLFAHLVHAALGPGGHVVFDDMHQGLSTLYDPAAFFADPRLHRSLGFLVAFWVLYLIGFGNRLAPPQDRPTPPRVTELANAVGGLFARRANRREVGQALLAGFADELRSARGLPADGRLPEDLLSRAPGVARADVVALIRLRDRSGRWSRGDLTHLYQLLQSIRKGLHDHRRPTPGD